MPVFRKLRNLCLFFVIIFGITGIFGMYLAVNRVSKCTEEVVAEVVDIRTETRYDSDMNKRMPMYRSVYEFQCQGSGETPVVKYQVVSRIASRPARNELHDLVKLHVNPDNPSEFYETGPWLEFLLPAVPLVLACVALAGFILCVIKIGKLRGEIS